MPKPFWPKMTEKKTNRFTDFTFGQKDDGENMKENRFHHHEIKLWQYGARIKHLTILLITNNILFKKATYELTNHFNILI